MRSQTDVPCLRAVCACLLAPSLELSQGSAAVVDGAAASSASGSKKDSVLRHEEHLAHCLLPLLSVFQLDEHMAHNPPALTAAQVAAQAVDDAERKGEEAEQQKAAPSLSLDTLLRSPSASPVLLEILHTAQAIAAAADSELKAPALIALRPHLQQAIDAALDRIGELAAAMQPKSEQQDESISAEGGASRGRSAQQLC